MTELSPVEPSELHRVGLPATLLRRTNFVYEVRSEGKRRGRFENLLDALASAQIAKQEHPVSNISVVDVATGKIVIETEAG